MYEKQLIMIYFKVMRRTMKTVLSVGNVVTVFTWDRKKHQMNLPAWNIAKLNLNVHGPLSLPVQVTVNSSKLVLLWMQRFVQTVSLPRATVFQMSHLVGSRVNVKGSLISLYQHHQQKNAFNSVTQPLDVGGSPFMDLLLSASS